MHEWTVKEKAEMDRRMALSAARNGDRKQASRFLGRAAETGMLTFRQQLAVVAVCMEKEARRERSDKR